ncbi:MAG: PAS domain S-box protein [Flavobacteriales bacterium]|nr:PAS domain S-box protein [Flavobacteriales bacterium]
MASIRATGSAQRTTLDLGAISELLFRTATEGLVVVDRDGRIVLVNPRLAELFGYGENELIGKTIEDLVPRERRGDHRKERTAYQQAPRRRNMGGDTELTGLRKDGTQFPIEVGLNVLDLEGERFTMGLVTDITKRRTTEQALQRSYAEMEERVEVRTAELKHAEQATREALEREKELNALKSRFVSMASHEFRTPLSTIMSSVDLIGRYNSGANSAHVQRHVTKIRGKVKELTVMLNDMLSLERLEQGRTEGDPSTFDVVHVIIELIEDLRDLAKPGQEIRYEHTGEQRGVFMDQQMLMNIMRNLITNALKYSGEGLVVDVHSWIREGSLHVEVRDRGMGIPAEDQQHLFERFFRASNVMTIQGTGLGLNIVKRYLELMGGTITFDSTEGEGTTFRFTVPTNTKT